MITTKTPESAPEVHQPGQPGPTPRTGKTKKRGLIWVFFLVVIAGVAGYAVWRAGRPAARQGSAGGGRFRGGFNPRNAGIGPVPVVVNKVSRASVPIILPGLGNVQPFYSVTVKSRVDGQLMKVDFKEGDLVKEGQPIIEIDPRPYQAQVDLAEATLAHDQALLDDAKLDETRYTKLLETDAIQSQQLDTQHALVKQYEATIKQDQANINTAKLNVTYAHITAPISGVMGLRLVDPGNIVHAADASGMVVINQLQPISVYFTIPEDSLPRVMEKLRAGANLRADAYTRDNSKKLASGALTTPDNQIDSTTGTAKLKAVYDNQDLTLFPQQFVNIRLLVDTLANQLVVPNVAVQTGQQGTFVYVVDADTKVHFRPVQVGVVTETVSQILGGLSDGDRVVVDGTDRLVEGTLVRVRKPGELENPPGYDPTAFGNGGGKKGGRSGGKKGGGNFKTRQGGGPGR